MQIAELSLLTDRVRVLLHDRIQIELPEDDVDLIESGTLDSLKFIQLLISLEQDFEIEIDLEQLEFETFRSVALIARFVADRTGTSA
jgi:acyl carrier protein